MRTPRPLSLAGTTLGLGLLGLSPAALAGWPNDVQVSQLSAAGGAETFQQVVREMGAVIANKPLTAARTSGIHGFDAQFTTTVGFVDGGKPGDETLSPWQQVRADGEAGSALWIPGVAVRKGLPLGLEAGASLGYIAGGSQTTFGAWGRWGLVEGYRQFPDLSVQVGYAGLVGNPELDLGVMDTTFKLGYTFPFGRVPGFNSGDISPYLGAGWLQINGSPRLSDEARTAAGVQHISGFKNKDSYTEGLRPATIHGGFRLRSGDVQLQAAAVVTTTEARATTSLNLALGYSY